MSHVGAVDLGFVDECPSWKLESRLFPSKVGGKPAWLDLENLPNAQDLQCKVCGQQLIFLCQVYAPYEEDDDNFHRTLFIFICRNASCCRLNQNDNIKIFRSHLRRQNKFYSEEPPVERPDPDFSLAKWVKLCSLCGCLGEKQCSKCGETYCSREHQVADWREGHKNRCGADTTESLIKSRKLFQEFQLSMEPEVRGEADVEEAKELLEYERLKREGKAGTMVDVSEEDLQAHSSVDEDKTFSRFRKRVDEAYGQVLRYERGGTPLWIAKGPMPDVIPDCDYCGGPRQFEFQVMTHMLSMFKEEHELDWGVLVVYTCRKSCTDANENRYKTEYVFKQDVSVDAAS